MTRNGQSLWLIGLALWGCGGGGTPRRGSPESATMAAVPVASHEESASSASSSQLEDNERRFTVRLFFPETASGYCRATREVGRALPPDADPVAFAVTELLQGPTQAERAQGLTSPFERSVADPDATPLRHHFLRVRVVRGIAIVNFGRGGYSFLNQAACAAEAVKSAIERTLLALPAIRGVKFAVEGEILDEFDA